MTARAAHEWTVRVLARHHQVHPHAATDEHREELDDAGVGREVGVLNEHLLRAQAMATV